MEEPQIKLDDSRGPELIIPDTLRDPFANSSPPLKPRSSGRKIFKLITVILVVIIGVIGGYFVLSNYFPQYAGYISPYLGPVLDPVLEQIQPVLDKIGLAKPTPQGSPSINSGQFAETANWKTYRNFEYGFEFKYPGDWTTSSTEKSGFLNLEKRYNQPDYDNPETMLGFCKLGFYKLEKKESETIRDVIVKNFKENFGIEPNLSQKIIDSREGSEQTTGEMSIVHSTYLPLDDTNFLSISLFCGDDVRGVGKSELNQILSTFKYPPDSDSDGLPDTEESKYGTDMNNPDTDGDTWPDGEEVQNGYNPLGPGKAQ